MPFIKNDFSRFGVVWAFSYSARSYASAEYWIYLKGRLRGFHVFGYYSAENEPIWMKFGALEYIVRDWPWQILARSAQ